MSQSDTNFSAKSSILQTSEIFTIVYTNAIDSVILDLQTKAVKMFKKYVHNLNEAKALTKESILNGSFYDLDNCIFLTHSGKYIATVHIYKNNEVVLKTDNGEFITIEAA